MKCQSLSPAQENCAHHKSVGAAGGQRPARMHALSCWIAESKPDCRRRGRNGVSQKVLCLLFLSFKKVVPPAGGFLFSAGEKKPKDRRGPRGADGLGRWPRSISPLSPRTPIGGRITLGRRTVDSAQKTRAFVRGFWGNTRQCVFRAGAFLHCTLFAGAHSVCPPGMHALSCWIAEPVSASRRRGRNGVSHKVLCLLSFKKVRWR